MATTEYRIQGRAKRPLSLSGHTYQTGELVTYEMGETELEFTARVARGMRVSLDEVTIMSRTISAWQPLNDSEPTDPEPDTLAPSPPVTQ